jgi:hypothetical protein
MLNDHTASKTRAAFLFSSISATLYVAGCPLRALSLLFQELLFSIVRRPIDALALIITDFFIPGFAIGSFI